MSLLSNLLRNIGDPKKIVAADDASHPPVRPKLPLIEPVQMPFSSNVPPRQEIFSNFPISTRTISTVQPNLNDNGLPAAVHEAGHSAPSGLHQSWLERLPPITLETAERPRFGNSAPETSNDFPTAPPRQLPLMSAAKLPPIELTPEHKLEAARRQREIDAAAPVVDNDKGWKKKLGAILREGLIGAGQAYRTNPQGGWGAILGGAGGGALGYGLNQTVDEQRTKDFNLAQQDQSIGRMEKGVKFGNAQALKQAQTNTINNDDIRADAKNQADVLYKEEEQRRKSAKDAQEVKEYEADSKHKRVKLIADTISRMSSFDPNDPRNADLVKEARAVGFPVFPKDAKKNVKYIQDERSGAWFTSVVDTATGKEETRPITTGGNSSSPRPAPSCRAITPISAPRRSSRERCNVSRQPFNPEKD